MFPPCPVEPGALVRVPGGNLGRVVEIHTPSRTALVALGDETERFGLGEIAPVTMARHWPPRTRSPRLHHRPRPDHYIPDTRKDINL